MTLLDAPARPAAADDRGAKRPAVAVSTPLPRIGLVSGVGLGTSVVWLSLLVLIPLAAVVSKGLGGGWSGFWAAITTHQALLSLRLTVESSLVVCAINAVMGTLIAWVLVRDDFPGKRVIEVVIDIPFALPTIVAGVVLLSVYGTNSPVGIDLLGTQRGVAFTLLFVTLPFVVRTVQPVLIAIDLDAEQAAASLGASRWTAFRRVVLPLLLPAIGSGTALAFARAMGEYGSVNLLAGGLNRTEVSSMYTYQQIQNFDYAGAAATATVLLVISLLVIVGLNAIQRWAVRHG
jgi:sulfate transport system permease protein